VCGIDGNEFEPTFWDFDLTRTLGIF